MKLKSISLVVLVSLAAGTAQASHTFLRSAPGEQHAARGEYVSFEVNQGASYKEDFYFSLSTAQTLSASLVINTEEGTTNDMDWLNLWKVVPMMWQPPGSGIEGRFTANSTAFHHTFVNVPAGNYYYELSGINTAQAINQIIFQSHIVASKSTSPAGTGVVPEPASYLLLASGMALLGVRKRRNKG